MLSTFESDDGAVPGEHTVTVSEVRDAAGHANVTITSGYFAIDF